jgi:hypothetical protein
VQASAYSNACTKIRACTHTHMVQEATEAASHCAPPGQEMVNSFLCGSARTPAPPEPSVDPAPSQLLVTSLAAVASDNSRLRMQVPMYSLSPSSDYTFLTWTCLQTQLEKADVERNTLQARLLNSEEELDESKRKSLTLEEPLNRFSVTLDDIEMTDMDPIFDLLSRSRSFVFPHLSLMPLKYRVTLNRTRRSICTGSVGFLSAEHSSFESDTGQNDGSVVKGPMDEGCSSSDGGNDGASDVEQLGGRVMSRTVHSSAASSPAHTRRSVGSSTCSVGTVQAREELACVGADMGDFVGDVMSGVLGACTNRSGSTVSSGQALEELVQLDGNVADLQDDVVSGVVDSFPSTRSVASNIGHSTRRNTSPAAALHLDPAEIENTWARLMLQEGMIVFCSLGDESFHRYVC